MEYRLTFHGTFGYGATVRDDSKKIVGCYVPGPKGQRATELSGPECDFALNLALGRAYLPATTGGVEGRFTWTTAPTRAEARTAWLKSTSLTTKEPQHA